MPRKRKTNSSSEEDIQRISELTAKLEKAESQIKETELKCEMAIIEAKKNNQNQISQLETEIETTLRAQLSQETKQALDKQSLIIKTQSDDLQLKSTALKASLDKIEALSSKNKDIQLLNEELNEKLKINEAQVRQLAMDSSLLQETRKKLVYLEPKSIEDQQKIGQLEKNLTDTQQKLEDEKIMHLKTRNELEKRLASLQQQNLEKQNQKTQHLYQEIESLKLKIKDAESQLFTQKEKCTSKNAQLDISKQNNQRTELELKNALDEIKNLKDLVSSFELKNKELKEQNSNLHVEVEDLNKKNKELELKVSDASSRLFETMDLLSESKLKFKSMESLSSNESLVREVQDLKDQIGYISNQKRSLQDEVKRLNRYSSESLPDQEDPGIKLTYLRLTLSNFISAPQNRKALVPILSALLELTQEESKNLMLLC